MTVPIWPWADSHLSSDWPWLRNVSTSATLAKGEDYPVTGVDAGELNLTNATYEKNRDGTYQIHTSLQFDTGAIYGTVTGVLNPDGTMSIKPDTYNFDWKNPLNANSMNELGRLFLRNTATGVGLAINGYGMKYQIQFTGSIPAPTGIPK